MYDCFFLIKLPFVLSSYQTMLNGAYEYACQITLPI